MSKIIKLKKDFTLNYQMLLPFKLDTNCIECGAVCRVDFSKDFDALYYTKINKPDHIWIWCMECGVEFEKKIKITVEMEALD